MRRRGGRLLTAVALVLVTVATAASASLAPVDWAPDLPAADAPAPPPLQPVEVLSTTYFDEIPVPEGVRVLGVEYAPDFRHWLLNVVVDGATHLAVISPGADDYRCVTCASTGGVRKVRALDDERRIWFSDSEGQDTGDIPVPGTGGTGDYQWFMLECAPSIYDCASSEILPVDFPLDSLTTLPEGAQNREASPDPSGKYIAWNEVRTSEGARTSVGKLVREAGRYRLADVRVVQPDFSLSDDPADWVHGGRFYEGGSFWAGNHFLKYQTTRTALNYDTGIVDLRTGNYRFLTRDLDYNETGQISPSGEWITYSSARGLDRMDVFTQLVRPPFLDMVSFAQIGRVGLWNNRRCMNEAWLMDIHGQRADGYGGQPLITEDNWLARQRQWLPDGRHLLLQEQLLPNVAAGVPQGRQFRVRLVRLPMLPEQRPLPPIDLDTLDWSRIGVPAAEYRGMASRQVPLRTIRGREGGTATVSFSGTFAAGSWKVRFDRYSDDGKSFISGVESLTSEGSIASATWSADLTSSGALEGFLRGTVEIGPQNTFAGDVTTEVNGKRWSGIPTQADCPGVRQAPLRVSVEPSSGEGRAVVSVTALLPEDPSARPVHGALVRVGDRSARTDATGRVVLTVPGQDAVTVQATAGGFAPGETTYRG